MMHKLKIWPAFWDDVASGLKKYEVRRADRNYRVGDELLLQEWDPETKTYSGRSCLVQVKHITETYKLRAMFPDFPSVCVMGIEIIA